MPGIRQPQRQPESDYCTHSRAMTQMRRTVLMPSMLLSLAMLALPAPTQAQTPVAPKAAQAKQPELRALGVLEWTGEAEKPSASRLVPVAIFTGTSYQDASLYLARPEPLAVQRDTEYELLQAGIAKGRFDIFSAGNVEGSWFGYGVWKPTITIRPPKLAVSKTLPDVVKDVDSDRPHFAHDEPSTTQQGSSPSSAKTTTAAKDAPPASASSQTHISSTSDDPERPKLRKRQVVDAAAQSGNASAGDSAPTDPDRPKLHHGKPEELKETEKLTGMPPRLQQMVAISTTAVEEPHSYAYQWANPEDEIKMQAALEKLAEEALAAQHPPVVIGAAPQKTRAAKPARALPPPILAVDDSRAFELSYSGGATMVFSCRAQDPSGPERFVTIIAQPDFYGSPRVLLKQVTDAAHLDVTPRMKLVDAVDVNGDHRAELVFELRAKGERQFAIYRVTGGQAEQVFLTSPIP
jgi:hypothetical protein